MSSTICFDLRCLQIGHESRGVGMHVRSIIEHLKPEDGIEYVFYVFDDYDPVQRLDLKLQVPYRLVKTPRVKKSIDRPQDFYQLSKIIWHKFTPLRAEHVDVFVQFDFMLGLPSIPRTKTVLIAYDVIPLIFSSEYLPTPRYALRNSRGTAKLKKTLRATYYRFRYRLHYKNFQKANLLLSISEATSRDIVKYLKVDNTKIVTLPLAPVFNTTETRRPNLLPKTVKRFIFYIGATDSRKRVEDLVAAYNILRGRGETIALVLAGKEFTPQKPIPNESIRAAINSSAYQSDIFQIGYVDDAEKTWLYSHAASFVFPTIYEGFGLPVTEATLLGCPTVSYDNSSIPEVASNLTTLVPTSDYVGLARAIVDVLGKKRVPPANKATYNWDDYVNRFIPAILRGK